MPDPVASSANATAQPMPVDTQSAPLPNMQPPSVPIPNPGVTAANVAPTPSWFSTLAHSVAGAVLGVAAARDKEIAPPSVAADGTMQPAVTTRATTGDQLRQMARSALTGLAAGARIQQQKSGVATALAGLGAGADDAIQRGQDKDLLERKQAGDDYERQQQQILSKAQNAHIIAETAKMVQSFNDDDFATQSQMAARGKAELDAQKDGGNDVPVEDLHKNDVLKYMTEHRGEYIGLTPLLTKAEQKDNGTVDRYYSLVDSKKPIKLTQSLIDGLQKAGIAGADKLEAGTSIPGEAWSRLWYQPLQAHNQASTDPRNWKTEPSSDAEGNSVIRAVNASTGQVKNLLDPDTGKPLSGGVKTKFQDIYDSASGKNGTWVVRESDGKKLHYVGESPKDMNNPEVGVGDYSKDGEEFIQSLRPQMQDTVRSMHDYHMDITALPRGQEKQKYIDALNHAYKNDEPFDENQYKLRQAYLKEYNSGTAGEGQARDRINNAIGHLDLLNSASQGLAKGSLLELNKLANEYGFQTGQSPTVLWNLVADKAAAELAASTGNNNLGEIETMQKHFRDSSSPKQMGALIKGNLELLNTQVKTIADKYTKVMKRSPDEMNNGVISKENKAVMDRTLGSQSGQSRPHPANVPANYVYNASGAHGAGWYDPAIHGAQ